MKITPPALIELSKTLEGRDVKTLGSRQSFRVNVLEDDAGLKFIPNSTGEPRSEKLAKIRELLERYELTGSLRKTDYHSYSFNASYVLALIKHFQDIGGLLSIERIQAEFERSVAETQQLPDEELLRRMQKSPEKPSKVQVSTTAFVRNKHVASFVLNRAKGRCEQCGIPAPFLRASDGEPYLEIHHKVRLVDGGIDRPENALALCPNCHRRAHYGQSVVKA